MPAAHEYWDRLGVSDDPLIDRTDSAFARGLPSWPTGYERYRIIRTWQSLIIATEGLFPRGLECYLELPHAEGILRGQVEHQWHLSLLSSFASGIATGALLPLPAATALPAPPSAPLNLYGELQGRLIVPVLIDVHVPSRPAHHEGIRYVPLTPITPEEFEHVRAGGLEDVMRIRREAKTHHVDVDSREVTDGFIAQLPASPDSR